MARKDKSEDVGQRLTEMLDEQGQVIEVVKDNTPPPGQSLQQLGDTLANDYNRVQQQQKAGNLDKEFVADLARRFMAVASNPELRDLVSFDAARAADVLYDLASGQKRESITEYYRIVRYL